MIMDDTCYVCHKPLDIRVSAILIHTVRNRTVSSKEIFICEECDEKFEESLGEE